MLDVDADHDAHVDDAAGHDADHDTDDHLFGSILAQQVNPQAR